jgi:hypothetical protein
VYSNVEHLFRLDHNDTIPSGFRRWCAHARRGDLFQIKFGRAILRAAKFDDLTKKLIGFIEVAFGIVTHGRIKRSYSGKFFAGVRIHTEHFVN